MKKEILKEMQRRIVKSFLDILTLARLKIAPQSAYDVIAFIHKKFHILISAGTVYATLYSLERKRLVQGKWARRKRGVRVYELTERGEKTIQAFLKVNNQIQHFLANLLDGPME